jgi:cell division protein FtsW
MEKATQPADRLFLFLLGILMVAGLVLLTSASAPVGFAKFNDPYFFIKKQALFGLLPGVVLFLFFIRAKTSLLLKFSGIAYIASLVLLFLVFIPGVGLVINGSRSWVQLAGFSFQPSEFVKLTVIIILAKMLSESGDLSDWKSELLPIFFVISPAAALVALQPDIGTLSILAVIVFAMLYIARTPKKFLFVLGLAGVAFFALMLILAPYRVRRLTTFLHPELDPQGIGYQINQAYLAIGSGGMWGLGLGHSRQKFQYLPEVQADSIFAVIAEEMGLFATSALVLLITFLGLRGLRIAKGAPDQFGRLLASGIMVWFMWQSFLNIGTIIGLLPLTGVPLPFISHGGSALIIGLASMGVVAGISRFSNV